MTLDLIIAERERAGTRGSHLCTVFVVSPETDAAILILGDGMRLGNIVIQRGEEQQAAHGAIGVEQSGEMLCVLLAITSQSHDQQPGEQVTR